MNTQLCKEQRGQNMRVCKKKKISSLYQHTLGSTKSGLFFKKKLSLSILLDYLYVSRKLSSENFHVVLSIL